MVILAPFWVLAVWGARDDYMQTIRNLLMSKRGATKSSTSDLKEYAETLANLKGEHSFDRLKSYLAHQSSVTRKMSATACLAFNSSARDVNRVKRLVSEMVRYEALELKGEDVNILSNDSGKTFNGVLDRYLLSLLKIKQNPKMSLKNVIHEEEETLLIKLSECLNNPHQQVGDKRKAIMILSTLGTQGAVDILLSSLATTQDHSLRFNLIRALNRVRAKGLSRQFNTWIIKKEILSEISNSESLILVLSEFRLRKSGKIRPREDYLLATLEALREESLERIFRLLALLYASDVIHVIHDRLVELGPDRHLRANALELLENVVEPELARKLRPIFEDSVHHRVKQVELEETIEMFLESKDQWLQICAVFLIAELGLEEFYQSIRDTSHARSAIVREASEIALKKLEK